MKTYAQLVAEDRRLQTLRLLAESGDYTAAHSLLQSALASVGHPVASDRLHTDLAWLEEQGLVQLSAVAGITLAKLTARGLDVSAGRAEVPGVNRPGPGA